MLEFIGLLIAGAIALAILYPFMYLATLLINTYPNFIFILMIATLLMYFFFIMKVVENHEEYYVNEINLKKKEKK